MNGAIIKQQVFRIGQRSEIKGNQKRGILNCGVAAKFTMSTLPPQARSEAEQGFIPCISHKQFRFSETEKK